MRRKLYGFAVIVAGSASCVFFLMAGAFLSQGDLVHAARAVADGLMSGSIAGLIHYVKEMER